MKLWKPRRLDIRIAAVAQATGAPSTWLYSFEPAHDTQSTLSVTTEPEFHDITGPGDMMRNFKPTGAFKRFALEAELWKGADNTAEWKSDPPPVAETVNVAATVRNDEPVLQLMLVDVTGDFRVVQLTEDAAYDMLDGAMRFIQTLRRNSRRGR